MKRTHGRRMRRMYKDKEAAKDAFFHEMFHQNCEEREAYNQSLYTFEEYFHKNKEWLEAQWANMEHL